MATDSGAASALTSSPRGLAVLSGLCGEDPDVWTRRLPGPLDDPTAHPFVTRRPALGQAWGERPSLDDPERLAVEVALHGSGDAWRDRSITADAVARHGPAFLVAAEELLAAPGAAWWGEDIARDAQVVLGPAGSAPDLAARAADQFRMLGAAFHGRIPQALATSRRLGERLPAVGLCDPDISLLTRGPAGCWAVPVPADARVHEVHGPAHWRALLARYPRHVPTTEDLRRWGVTTDESVVPDWEAFARDWDGVHVSLLGVLTAQGVPVEVDGMQGVLEDVDTEVTAWLRPCLGAPVLIATVAEDGIPHLPPGP